MSIEKVLLHLNERKEKTLFSWVDRELSGLWRMKDEDLKQDIQELKQYIQSEDYERTKDKILEIKSKIETKIDKLYKEFLD